MKKETLHKLIQMDFMEAGRWITDLNKKERITHEQAGKLWKYWSKHNKKTTIADDLINEEIEYRGKLL